MENLKNRILYATIALVSVFGIAGLAYSYLDTQTINVAGDYNSYGAQQQPEEVSFGAIPGTYIVVDDLEYGSALSKALNFTAGATTTPGGLFKILNVGTRKICDTVEIDVKTGDTSNGRLGTGHPIVFSVATSTASNALSANVGLIATTTLATGTTDIIDSVQNPGTYVNADQDIGGAPWVWGKGVYLLGQFDSLSTDPATSSLVYTGMAGKAYVRCHVE